MYVTCHDCYEVRRPRRVYLHMARGEADAVGTLRALDTDVCSAGFDDAAALCVFVADFREMEGADGGG